MNIYPNMLIHHKISLSEDIFQHFKSHDHHFTLPKLKAKALLCTTRENNKTIIWKSIKKSLLHLCVKAILTKVKGR